MTLSLYMPVLDLRGGANMMALACCWNFSGVIGRSGRTSIEIDEGNRNGTEGRLARETHQMEFSPSYFKEASKSRQSINCTYPRKVWR